MKVLQIIRRVHPETALVKCMAVLLAYFFGSYVTGHFHQESGFTGVIGACTSAILSVWIEYVFQKCRIIWRSENSQ